jgi:hypothetical protein
MATNFQHYLDQNYNSRSAEWSNELANLDLTSGDFTVADANHFFQTVTKKSVANWAVSCELTTRNDSLKKIIDSV